MSRYIPEAIKRKLLEETQFRCAFCLLSIEQIFDDSNFFHFAENAHIQPHNESLDNSFENLICLCPNCHKKFDKNRDRDNSVSRLKALKSHWFVASGNYSKLELDCLFDLFRGKPRPWIFTAQFSSSKGGKPFNKLYFSVPTKQGYLFQNLISNRLVDYVKQQGAFSGNSLILGDNLPAEDTLLILLNEKGEDFCKKFVIENTH